MPSDGLVIILAMGKFVDSSYLLPGLQYLHRLEYNVMRLFLRIKIAYHNAYILKIYNRQYFKLVLFIKHSL